MENVSTIVKDFGCVPCGVKVVETFKFENNTKKTQFLEIYQESKKLESSGARLFLNDKLHIQPTQVELKPKQIVCFKLSYYSHVEDVSDNFAYDIFDSETLVARLFVHASSVGSSLHPTTFNVKFFCFRDVNQTLKHIEISNTTKQEAKFYFDVDEDYHYFEISQPRGVIPGGLKFGLKLTFNPIEPGIYYKRIFCIIQFHKPLIFNLIAVYKPKAKLDPRNLTLKYPLDRKYSNSYEAYMYKEEFEKLPDADKTQALQKCLEGLDLSDLTNTTGSDHERSLWTVLPEPPFRTEIRKFPGEIFLTTNFIDMKNLPEIPTATSILNFSKCQHYYYEWDHDPRDHFQVSPCKGLMKPNSKADFTIYFTPSVADRLYHIEIDLRIFPCNEEPQAELLNTIELPVMTSLRIIGHSFPDDSCGWVPQCKISPKILHLRACVPGERIYGTFIMEREGHLPVTFSVAPTKDRNFTVRPPLGYLSKSFQLFVVQFDSHSKEQGVFTEDLKIKFNNTDRNMETIRVATSVELPRLIFGKNNEVTFAPVFPGSKVTTLVQVKNPTRLQLRYEFLIPESMTWLQIVNPTGSINPKGSLELKIIFKPDYPSEYMDYIPCHVSSMYKPDYFEEIPLRVIGSCQFGYLVAIPSIHSFGECLYKKEKTIEILLFNFSFILLYFRLRAISSSFPPSDADADVVIIPNRGKVPAKGSIKIEVNLTPHKIGYYEYAILCQNFQDDSPKAEPCEAPRKVILLKVNVVFPCIQIIDLNIYDGGPLFSPHLLWKMLCVDQVNAALRSLHHRQVIKVKIPEAVKNSRPISLALLIETKYHRLAWTVNMETQCPCYEASARNLGEECLHTKAILVRPTKYVTEASEKTVLMLKIHYDFANESMIVMTIHLPYKKELKLKMPLISLPADPPTCLSTYLNPTLSLKPVFIGDQQPPLQLFWLYNNTKTPASYSLDVDTFLKGSEQNVFNCINPQGVIPGYSSHPLGIIFSPNEMKTYSVEVLLELGRQVPVTLHLIGEGVLKVETLNLTALKNPLPKEPIIKTGDLECCENYINIPFVGVHSRTSEIFYLENTSKTDKWSFDWTSYKFDNIVSIRIEPDKGVVDPGQKVPMTLSVKTYSYPTSLSFSISCEIVNFSQLHSYRDWVKIHEIVAERDRQQFTITDRGTTFTETKVTKTEKPLPRNIFLTVNINILSDSHMQDLINKKVSYGPKAIGEIYKSPAMNVNPLTPPMLRFVQGLLEKLLWDILYSQRVTEKIQDSRKFKDLIYKQIQPQSQKKREELKKLFEALPSTDFVQDVLEITMQELICKSLLPGFSQSRRSN